MEESKQNPVARQGRSQPVGTVNLENYHDLGGVTLKKLEFGLWFLEHDSALKRMVVIILSAIAIISWGYFIYNFGYYLAKGMKEDERLQRELVATREDSHQIIERNMPKNLMLDMPVVLSGGEGRYDFVVGVKNPNKKHWAELRYYLVIDGQVTEKISSFILADESRHLLLLGKKLESRPNNSELRLDEVAWHRLDSKTIPNWTAYRTERLNIEIGDVDFTPASTSGLSERLSLSQLDFTAQNKSPYNFWNAGFYSLLMSQGAIVGVNRYDIERFRSGETRRVESSQPGQFGGVDKVEIIPEINIMKPGVYMKFEASPQDSLPE